MTSSIFLLKSLSVKYNACRGDRSHRNPILHSEAAVSSIDSEKSISAGLIRNVEWDGAVVAHASYGLDPDGISIELFQEFADLVAR